MYHDAVSFSVHRITFGVRIHELVIVKKAKLIVKHIRIVVGTGMLCHFCDSLETSVWINLDLWHLRSLPLDVPFMEFNSKDEAGLLLQNIEELGSSLAAVLTHLIIHSDVAYPVTAFACDLVVQMNGRFAQPQRQFAELILQHSKVVFGERLVAGNI